MSRRDSGLSGQWQSGRSHRSTKRRPAFGVETLETRIALDGTGLLGSETTPSDPTFEPDPGGGGGSVVGQATLLASNDTVYGVVRGEWFTFDPIANDVVPSGDPARISQLLFLPPEISISVNAEGRRVNIDAPSSTPTGKYEFTYIVTTESGKQGSAVVTFYVQRPIDGPDGDSFTVLEDTADNRFDVLQNDRSFAGGEIVSVARGDSTSTVSISPDGKHINYAPAAGTRYDNFSYQVRRADGSVESASVWVRVRARYEIYGDDYELDRDSPAVVVGVMQNDRTEEPAESPRIVSIGSSSFGSRIELHPDGHTITYQPVAGFVGDESIAYTIKYGPEAHHVAHGSISFRVIEPILALDDWFFVALGATNQVLPVLANDMSRATNTNVAGGSRSLAVVGISQGTAGGQVSLDDSGWVRYTPPAGFVGNDTFTYTVRDTHGQEQRATAIVNVDEPAVAIGGRVRFRGDAELAQYLLENAIRRSQYVFGRSQIRQIYTNAPPFDPPHADVTGQFAVLANLSTRDHSSTNTQVAGIDEADIVETDGNFVYAILGDELLIVDMANLDEPVLASAMKLSFGVSEMYLIGDRLLLVNRGAYGSKGILLTLDVTNREDPVIVSRVEVEGRIIDTRAIGEEVTFVVDATVRSLQPESQRIEALSTDGNVATELWRYESLAEFTARVRGQIVHDSMPTMSIYDAVGNLVETRQLVAVGQIYRPESGTPMRLTAVGVLDASAGATAADADVASVGIMGSQLEQIYMSTSGVFVLDNPEFVERPGGVRSQETRILFFAGHSGGTSDDALRLVSAGSVRGTILNQFALDEFDGRLRIATTERVYGGAWSWQLLRTENHLFVLEDQDEQLNIVGSMEHLAPTTTIRSVRFMGEMAYFSTYRDFDPLLSVDLSNPASPQLRGVLVVPGFANYLHPIGDDFLIAFGRDDDATAGQQGAPQVSLFYVGDPDNPRLADRLTMRGATGTSSEAFGDHHAVAYFAEHRVLSLPINWQGENRVRSAAWLFDVDVDSAAGVGSLTYSGKIDHEFAVRRSLRIEDALVTVSDGSLKTHSIDDISTQRGNLYLAAPLTADSFTVSEDSTATTLDVLGNDHVGPNARIAAVEYGGDDGEFAISDDGRALLFTPAADFFGYVTAKYGVDVPGRGRREATVSVYVTNVDDAPRPANDEFDVLAGRMEVLLDVLANDFDPDRSGGVFVPPIFIDQPAIHYDIAMNAAANVTAVADGAQVAAASLQFNDRLSSISIWLRNPLKIVHVSAASQGGAVAISDEGDRVLYSPAAGFVGEEAFTYRVQSANGLTAEAIVVVRVAPTTGDAAANPDVRVRAATERRVARLHTANADAARLLVQGTRVATQSGRRIVRDTVAAAHDAALQATTSGRPTARRRSAVAAPEKPTAHAGPAPVVLSARRSTD